MAADSEWIDQQLRHSFGAAVAAGIGQWVHGQVHAGLSDSVYEYRAGRLAVCLCRGGLCYVLGEIVQIWKYEDIDEILSAPLRELVRVVSPDGMIGVGIRARGVLVMIEVPLKVYSVLCSTLLIVVKRAHARK